MLDDPRGAHDGRETAARHVEVYDVLHTERRRDATARILFARGPQQKLAQPIGVGNRQFKSCLKDARLVFAARVYRIERVIAQFFDVNYGALAVR